MANRKGSSAAFDTIRKGVPRTPLTDLYYHLLRAPWWQVLTLFAFSFLAINALFAGLYGLGGDCLEGVSSKTFSANFFFSVQTITTIGYGAMHPKTDYAHAMVSLESFVGIVMIAVATGLIFSKFARPRAKFVFSNNLLLTHYNGKRCLLMRIANARGNDVVEASVNIVVLKPEVTVEGHRLRRLHDLDLVRARTPLFVLSWLIIHEVDENSPIYGMSAQDMRREQSRFIVSLRGLDGTFAQDIYGRAIYGADDILEDHRFRDVISFLPSGGLEFDISKFHDVEIDPHDGSAVDDENLEVSPPVAE